MVAINSFGYIRSLAWQRSSIAINSRHYFGYAHRGLSAKHVIASHNLAATTYPAFLFNCKILMMQITYARARLMPTKTERWWLFRIKWRAKKRNVRISKINWSIFPLMLCLRSMTQQRRQRTIRCRTYETKKNYLYRSSTGRHTPFNPRQPWNSSERKDSSRTKKRTRKAENK